MSRRILPALCAAIVGCSETSVETKDPLKEAANTDRIESFRYGEAARPDARHFGAHGGIQTLPEIHAKYVEEFINVPFAFGAGRMPYRGPSTTPNWVEYVPASGAETVSVRNAVPLFDEIEHTLSLPDGTKYSTRETVWHVSERLLVSSQRETPEVYKEATTQFGATMHAQASAKPAEGAKPREMRPADAFEISAVEKLKSGQDLIVKTESHEMRLAGAIRARTECLACHTKSKAGDLLGAFTYTLKPLSFATGPEHQVKNLDALTAEQRAAVEAIEAVGGAFTQDAKGAITGVSFVKVTKMPSNGFTMMPPPVRNEDLKWLAVFPELQDINLRGCRIGDKGLKELENVTGLRKLDVSYARLSKEGLDSLKKALSKCEVIYESYATP